MSLNVYREGKVGATVVSNTFIDDFMKDANDAQLKVYLYLLRMMSANQPTGVSEMADYFNHTEKDIVRALKYWEKKQLLSLEYNEQGSLQGIRFLPISKSNASVSEERSLAPIVPLKIVPEEVAPVAKERPSYSRDQIRAFKEGPETEQIVFVAETYLKHTLTPSEIQNLYFIYDELKFSCEMIDYLLQYCLDRGKSGFSYIRSVAIAWAEAGITTPKQAKAASSRYDKNVYTILKALGKSGIPQKPEADMAIRWYRDYGFEMDVILEACNRTVMATDSHRLEYCDKILSSWKEAGIHTTSDIANRDAVFKRSKVSQERPKNVNSFNCFTQTNYDFDSLEKLLTN